MADELGLPKSNLQKGIKDNLPADMRIAGDATDLIVQACNQFVHLVSTQANDISEREKRSTISPEHVVRALEELEFGAQYLDAVRAAWEEWKADNKEHHGKLGAKKQGSGLTQQQLIELQQKLFEEARAATLSGPLPSMAVAEAAAAVTAAQGAAAGQQQQQQQQQQQEPAAAQADAHPAAAAAAQPAAAAEPQEAAPAEVEVEAAAAEDDEQLSDDDYSGSSEIV